MTRFLSELVGLIFFFMVVRSAVSGLSQVMRGGGSIPKPDFRTPQPQPQGDAMRTSGELRKDPVCGTFVDEFFRSIGSFTEEVERLSEALSGEALLASLEKFSMKLAGDGHGGVWVFVELQEFVPSLTLKFDFGFDQTYLPPIIEALRREF